MAPSTAVAECAAEAAEVACGWPPEPEQSAPGVGDARADVEAFARQWRLLCDEAGESARGVEQLRAALGGLLDREAGLQVRLGSLEERLGLDAAAGTGAPEERSGAGKAESPDGRCSASSAPEAPGPPQEALELRCAALEERLEHLEAAGCNPATGGPEQQLDGLQGRLADLERALRQELWQERSARETDVDELRELVRLEKLAHEGDLSSVNEVLAKESQSSMDERISREEHCGAVQASLEARLAEQYALLDERIHQLKELLLTSTEINSPMHATIKDDLFKEPGQRREPLAFPREGLGRFAKRLEQEARREQATREAEVSVLRQLIVDEKTTREGDVGALRDLLTCEQEARERQLCGLQAQLTLLEQADAAAQLPALTPRGRSSSAAPRPMREGRSSHSQGPAISVEERLERLELLTSVPAGGPANGCNSKETHGVASAAAAGTGAPPVCGGELEAMQERLRGLEERLGGLHERLAGGLESLQSDLESEKLVRESAVHKLGELINGDAREAHAAHVRDLLADEVRAREAQLASAEGRLADSLEGERGRREAVVQELQGLLGDERAERTEHLGSVRELLAQELQAREAQVASVRELVMQETAKHAVQLDEIRKHLACEREAREQCESSVQASIEGLLAELRPQPREPLGGSGRLPLLAAAEAGDEPQLELLRERVAWLEERFGEDEVGGEEELGSGARELRPTVAAAPGGARAAAGERPCDGPRAAAAEWRLRQSV